ncbi:hypothetical protein ACIA8O_21450 [Kitasatospora sp. NPDC051853]|uniref:hypothetical protein n=1 Tax=Kitasatospora sp. NPDC051853 TaxID=3364058 RepID=UPI0037B431DC
MTGQTVRIPAPCDCGALAVRQVNQFVERGELWWDAEFHCTACGAHLCEHAGQGAPPDAHWRPALLAANGPTHLRLTGPVPSLVPVLKTFRELTGAPLPEARRLAGELIGGGTTGTLAEMELLRTRLRHHGLQADLSPPE